MVHPPSNGERLRGIQHSMSKILDLRFYIFDSLWHFITKRDRYYYKILQFLLPNATILLWKVTVIRKCESAMKNVAAVSSG